MKKDIPSSDTKGMLIAVSRVTRLERQKNKSAALLAQIDITLSIKPY
jgi:hypothetical protein